MERFQVSDWMSKPVISIEPHTTLPDAQSLMRAKMVRRLPIIADGRLLGIVTYGDLREASPSGATDLSVHELNYLLAKLPVEKIMAANPYTISPYASLTEAAKLMLERKIGGLPVVDGDEVVGMITESDIFRAFVHLMDEQQELAVAAV